MYQVIDTFRVNRELAARYRASGERFEEGLWVVLAPEQTAGVPTPLAGQIVLVRRPDGSTLNVPMDGAEKRHSVLALHFRQLGPEDIPRLSWVEW